jgi:hypothetical protein
MYNTYAKCGSAIKVKKRLWYKFQDVTVPHSETISGTVTKLRHTEGSY